ncbi:hypothetical protein QQP08_008916 [Theobroma cacao]|nr:hypothetical protein QQP08_008916 [Theobroma cacao]
MCLLRFVRVDWNKATNDPVLRRPVMCSSWLREEGRNRLLFITLNAMMAAMSSKFNLLLRLGFVD